MMYIKPKEMARYLGVPPEKVSIYAHDIENSTRYTFHKTPMGSFLFQREEVALLKEYLQIRVLFPKKQHAGALLSSQMQGKGKKKEKYPRWAVTHLKNAHFL